MNVVFVTVPRSFKHPYLNSQINMLNAIRNFNPESKVVLYSDDEGVYEFAESNYCIAPKRVDKIGKLPLVNSALKYTADLFPDSCICFINSDILVMANLMPLISYVNNTKFKELFVLTAYRKEANISSFLTDGDLDALRTDSSLKKGRHHAMDIFILPASLIENLNMPAYRVGRIGWDSWIAGKTRKLGLALIDISAVVRIVHQDHPQNHDKTGWNTLWDDWYSHGISNFGSLIDCNYKAELSKEGFYLRFSFKQHLYGTLIGRMLRAFRRILLAFFRENILKR
jgi:hypothetical protein